MSGYCSKCRRAVCICPEIAERNAKADRLVGLVASLEDNWDGDGAVSMTKRSLAIARELALFYIEKESLAAVPTVGGGTQLEWHEDGEDVEIEIRATENVEDK